MQLARFLPCLLTLLAFGNAVASSPLAARIHARNELASQGLEVREGLRSQLDIRSNEDPEWADALQKRIFEKLKDKLKKKGEESEALLGTKKEREKKKKEEEEKARQERIKKNETERGKAFAE